MYESDILQCKTYGKIEPTLTAIRLLTHVKRQKDIINNMIKIKCINKNMSLK